MDSAGVGAAEGEKPGRPAKYPKRQLINETRWRVRAESPWRDMPTRYEPWQTIYGLSGQQMDGTWAQILTRLLTRAEQPGLG